MGAGRTEGDSPPPADSQPSAAGTAPDFAALADALDDALPQTQCTRCGYADCRHYAQAIAAGAADIDRCPPGGDEGIARLAALTGRPVVPLDAGCGEAGPLRVAVIDEAACIGCTLCLPACPVDCIVGAARQMHTVIDSQCTGCELCLAACPVDCIAMVVVTPGVSGWAAWSQAQADEARGRYRVHVRRLESKTQAALPDASGAAESRDESPAPSSDDAERRRMAVVQAIARARAQQR